MDGCERQVAIDKTDLSRVGIQQGLIGFIVEAAAVWALEVAELYDNDLRIVRAEAWVAFGGDIVAGKLRLRGRRITPLT
jgi:hypothetical protein